MAEIVGVIASVAQLVHLSGTLLAGGYGFLSKVAHAPSEIRSLLTEAAAVNSILGQLQNTADNSPQLAHDDALQALERLGVFQECQTTLQFIQEALVRCQQEAGKDVKNLGRRLKWPFKERETKDALQRLHHLRSVLANAVEANSANSLRRIETSQALLLDSVETLTTHVQTQMSREEAQKVLSWLCPLSANGAHISLENALNSRLPGTGRWFLESKIFEEWVASRHSSIWITGLPGSGKTLLCASAIQKVRERKTERTAVLFFFCDHRDPAKLTHDNFVMSITRQMLDLSAGFLEHAKKMYDEKANNGDRTFNRADYIPLLESFMNHFEQVFILCDALDESSEGDAIASTLTRMLSYGLRTNVSMKILLTSRFDVQMERRHMPITLNRVALAENMKPDIDQYVKMEVDTRVAIGVLKLRDKSFQPSIQQHVASRAGTILHARLQLDYLGAAKNDRDLKNMVESLPDGLEHTHGTLLSHTASRYPERINEMRTLLQCLVIAAPTLTAANLAEILAMQPGQRILDFDAVATDPYDALDVIAPFLMLTNKRNSHSIVKLSHYSLDEYLLSDRILQGQASQFHVKLNEGNAWMAYICLQYLTLDVFNYSKFDMSRSGSPSLEQYTFRRYAALNWFRHFNKAKGIPGFIEQCRPYLSRLFNDDQGSPCYRRWQEIYRQEHPYNEIHSYSPICFAISQGMDEVVDDLLPLLIDVDVSFKDDHTCLTMAAKWNRASIVRKLLDLGADLEMPSAKQCTPLHLAAEFASREAFDILLDAGANPQARSSSGTTPFYRACRGGNAHIVRRLRECGSDINVRTHDSWTPIMEAVENGNEDVVDLLLEWGADLTIRTDQGWTVLLVAEDGFNLAPNLSVIEKLKRAAPAPVYQEFLQERDMVVYDIDVDVESAEPSADEPDAYEAPSYNGHDEDARHIHGSRPAHSYHHWGEIFRSFPKS